MEPKNSTVYEISNAAGIVLYVGRSSRRDITKRWAEHDRESSRLATFTKKELILAAFYDELQYTVIQDNITHAES